MFETVINFLTQHFPQVAGYVLIAAVVGILSWKFSRFYNKTADIHKEFPKIQKTLDEIKTGFTTLNQVLLEKQLISQSCFSNENSPRVINILGQKLYSQSGAGKIYEEIKDNLMAELELENLKIYKILLLNTQLSKVLL